jgi:rhodanese-related sulfurtransferase
LFTKFGVYLIFLLIGFGFGFVLELAGFANSKKLAAQFYFTEQTVLKVMFTAIIVAMLGVFLAAGLGFLDYNLIWVNPTYLWPGIIGGLIMGAGFIIGGFCPGTSLVAVATAKLDGVFFALGVLFGIFAFGESVASLGDFFYSSYMGRFTLPEFLGLPTGVVVLLVVLMALFMFWGAEQLERIFGGMDLSKAPQLRYYGAGALVLLGVAAMVIGQPTSQDKWAMLAPEKGPLLLEDRAYQIHPGELLDLMHNDKIKLFLLDLRSEADYNLFHLVDSKHTPLETLPERIPDFILEPSNAVFVLLSNHEEIATEGWKTMVAESVHNVYILEGGLNYWLEVFSAENPELLQPTFHQGEDQLHFPFSVALGSRHALSDPDPHLYPLEYTSKVKLELKKGPSGGGCG